MMIQCETNKDGRPVVKIGHCSVTRERELGDDELPRYTVKWLWARHDKREGMATGCTIGEVWSTVERTGAMKTEVHAAMALDERMTRDRDRLRLYELAAGALHNVKRAEGPGFELEALCGVSGVVQALADRLDTDLMERAEAVGLQIREDAQAWLDAEDEEDEPAAPQTRAAWARELGVKLSAANVALFNAEQCSRELEQVCETNDGRELIRGLADKLGFINSRLGADIMEIAHEAGRIEDANGGAL